MLRIVLDTNVFVSGLLTKQGVSAQILNAWRDRQFLLLTSVAIITELQNTLRYPHIRERYRITDAEVNHLTSLLEYDALLVPGHINVAGAVPEDPDDEKFLACAIDGQANYNVSGNHHLLELGEYQGIPILSVRQFIEQISRE